MTAVPTPIIANGRAAVNFQAPFNSESYQLFIKVKSLPEKDCAYDDRTDSYRMTFPERFVHLIDDRIQAPTIEHDLSSFLFDYQRFIDIKALEAKRFAAWCECGLGKTLIGSEYAAEVSENVGPVLIFAPRNVIREWRLHAEKFYGSRIDLKLMQTRESLIDWLTHQPKGIAITNYEKIGAGRIPELKNLAGIVADEASILKTGGGKTKWNLFHSSRGVEYKLAMTATPAPNETMEFASQASFLERLRGENEVLWTFFRRNPDTNAWELKPHAKREFFAFMASFSIYMRDPELFGFKDGGKAPDPQYFTHTIPPTDAQMQAAVAISSDAGGGLFADERMGVVERGKLAQIAKGFLYKTNQRFESAKPGFIAKLAIEEAKDSPGMIWCDFDLEMDLIAEVLTLHGYSSFEMYDGRIKSDEERDAIMERFQGGATRILITKAQSAGFGGNQQHVGWMIVSGVNDSFEALYQLIRRALRYGQTKSLRVHFPVIPELEGLQMNNTQAKAARFEDDVRQMELHYIEALGLRKAA